MRLLRQLLPHIDPRTLSQYEHAQLRRVKALRNGETPPELSPTEREFVFDDIGTPADDIVLNRGIVGTLQQLIGITFEAASSHCAQAVRQIVSVSSSHDVFSIANEAVAVFRTLLASSAWNCEIGRASCRERV